MAEPNLEEVFGTGAQKVASGATVAESGLFIPDSGFVAVGLTSPTTATAEAHLVALLKILQGHLTEASYEADTDRSIYIEAGTSSFSNRGESLDQYRVDPLTFNLAKLDVNSTLSPDDY